MAWRSHEGDLLDVFEIPPWIIKRLLWRAVQAWQWRQVGRHDGLVHLADGGVLEPLVRMTTTGAVGRHGAFGRHVQVAATGGRKINSDSGPYSPVDFHPVVPATGGQVAGAGAHGLAAAGTTVRFTLKERGYLSSVTVAGQWPQQRKYACGMALDDKCLLCGAVGTLLHRHCGGCS